FDVGCVGQRLFTLFREREHALREIVSLLRAKFAMLSMWFPGGVFSHHRLLSLHRNCTAERFEGMQSVQKPSLSARATGPGGKVGCLSVPSFTGDTPWLPHRVGQTPCHQRLAPWGGR